MAPDHCSRRNGRRWKPRSTISSLGCRVYRRHTKSAGFLPVDTFQANLAASSGCVWTAGVRRSRSPCLALPFSLPFPSWSWLVFWSCDILSLVFWSYPALLFSGILSAFHPPATEFLFYFWKNAALLCTRMVSGRQLSLWMESGRV